MDLGDIQLGKNTATLIADALRSAILQGKLQSGQSLRQDEIAAEFRVSKIPVREALVQLQAEGLVQLIPSRGAMVSELTSVDVGEIYAIRLALEPVALRKAIPRYISSDFLLMESILDRIDQEEDRTKWAELNWEFHETLYRPSGMPRLIQIVKHLHNNVARYLLRNYLDDESLSQSQHQHREIMALCRERNLDAATVLLIRHLSDPVEIVTSLLKHEG